MKGAISALSSLQGHLLVASGPKITLFKWTGTELNGVAFFDAPPLHAVSMNIVCIPALWGVFPNRKLHLKVNYLGKTSNLYIK